MQLSPGLGSSKVLVLGTWYLMRIIKYLVLTCTWPFEIQKYLVLTCTWWPKYLILVQVLKYFCQINKYSVLNLWICSCRLFTSEHHKQKWFIESYWAGLGSSKVLVLGTWYLMRIIKYLVLTCTWPFEIQKYLVLTCTWWPKYLILVQVLKYFCQINKYSVLNLWICSCRLFTSEHHKQKWFIESYWVCWEHMSQDVNSLLDCLLDLQARIETWWPNILKKFWRSLVQVATCLQFGASHYNQIDKCKLKPLDLTVSFGLQTQKVL